jgi:hypothetical protein
MTIHPSDPRDPNRDTLRRPDNGMGLGTMLAIAAAGTVGLGLVWYAVSDNRPNTASTNPPAIDRSAPPVTTGTGTNVNPGAAQNAPNPTPAAPPATPPQAR